MGGCNKAVLLENRQIVSIPAAVGEDGGMPDGLTAGIRDFAVVHDAGNTIRVFDVLGSVQIVHGPFERGIAVAACRQVPGGIQIDLVQHNAAKDTVILELIGIGVHCVGIFIIGDAGRVGGVSLVGLAVTKGNRDYTLAGVNEGAAIIGCANVGVVVGIAQPDGLAVQIFRDLDGIGPLIKNRTSGAGCSHICPIAVVPAGSAFFNDNKSAFVALGKVHVIRAIRIVTVVDDLVGAICLTLDFILVIPTCRDIPLQNRVPLENGKLGISANPLFGLAVDLVDGNFH